MAHLQYSIYMNLSQCKNKDSCIHGFHFLLFFKGKFAKSTVYLLSPFSSLYLLLSSLKPDSLTNDSIQTSWPGKLGRNIVCSAQALIEKEHSFSLFLHAGVLGMIAGTPSSYHGSWSKGHGLRMMEQPMKDLYSLRLWKPLITLNCLLSRKEINFFLFKLLLFLKFLSLLAKSTSN